MKIGYYCESPADQAAMAIFTEGILGKPPEPINMDLEAHSVPGFFGSLDGRLSWRSLQLRRGRADRGRRLR
jgi:hypothetical protein